MNNQASSGVDEMQEGAFLGPAATGGLYLTAATVQIQRWYRDPLSSSNQTTSLSNALEFRVAP